MRRNFLTACTLAACIVLAGNHSVQAQQNDAKTTESDEIIIRKKGGKDSKVTVEFKDGQITVNGKQLSDYKDDDVLISSRKTRNIQGTGRSLSITPHPGCQPLPSAAEISIMITTHNYTAVTIHNCIAIITHYLSQKPQGSIWH